MSSHGFSQEYPKLLNSKGTIPSDMLVSFEDLLNSQVITSSIYRSRAERLAEIEFYKKSSFWVTELLYSGDLLYGNEVCLYVNRVCDELLKNDAELSDKISVYIAKSPALNAFATDQGVIVVNIGLLARIESEAQLAMILAHEISHFQEKHNVSGHVDEFQIENDPKNQNESAYTKALNKHFYSRARETEADQKGLEIYARSNYRLSEVPPVFDLLANSEAPLFNDQLASSLDGGSELIHLSIPDSVFQKVLADLDSLQLEELAELNDALSTHPAPLERKSIIDSILTSMNDNLNQGEAFIVGASEFQKVKYLCSLEMPRLFLLNEQFAEAVYHSMVLKSRDEFPNYFDLIIAKSLLKNAMYAEEYGKSDEPFFFESTNAAIDSLKMYFSFGNENQFKADALAFIENLNERNQSEESRALREFAQKHIGEEPENLSMPGALKKGKVAVLPPKIIMADLRKDEVLTYLDQDKVTTSILEKQKKHPRIEVFAGKLLQSSQEVELNEISYLNTYFREAYSAVPSFPTDFVQIEAIRSKYGIERIVLPVGVRVKELRKYTAMAVYTTIIASGTFPIILPITITRAFVPKRYNSGILLEVDLLNYRAIPHRKFSDVGMGKRGFIRFIQEHIESDVLGIWK